MKNKTLRVCMLFLIPVLWLSCTEETVVKEEKNVEKVTYENINARDDAHLMKILQGFNPSGSSNGRTQSFDFGEVKLSEAIKVENPYKDIVRYSLILSTDPADPGFENVVLRDHKGEIYPYITRYEPDKDWLMEKGGKFETRTFTGTLKVLDINRTLLVEVAFNNGRGTEMGNYIKKNGRTECDDDGGGSTGGGSGGGGSGSGTGGNTGGGTGGDYGGGTGGSTGGGLTGGGPTGSGSTDGSSGGGGSDCEWGTSSTTGGLFIDCRAVDMGLYFFRTACDGGDFNDINLCDDPEFAATYSEACGEDPIGILAEEKIISFLNTMLAENPFALIDDISCEDLQKWQDVATTEVPQSVIDRFAELEEGDPNIVDSFSPYDDWQVQELEDASGIVVNMDYFPVNVTLPAGTPPEFVLEQIRTVLINELDGATFTPHSSLFAEDNKWLHQQTCVGSVLSISMFNDGSVVCIQQSSSSWTFATISDPRNFTHPVSGKREFGFKQQDNGSYTFYTRGVDRITDLAVASVREIGMFAVEADIMDIANEVWASYQNKIKVYVEEIGGSATILPATKERPDYDKLEKVLSGELPVSEYEDCN